MNRTRLQPLAASLALAWLAGLMLHASAWTEDGERPSLATWAPARTSLFVESGDPKRLGEELAKLCAASPLGEFPNKLTFPEHLTPRWLAETAWWLSPEGLPELQRCDGVAYAFLGRDGKGVAQEVWFVKTGASTTLQERLKKQIAAGAWKEHQDLAGVKSYYSPKHIQMIGGAGPDGSAKDIVRGYLLALFPGGVAYGSAEAVAEVILRAKGDAVGPALAADARFKELRRSAPHFPGALAYLQPERLDEGGMALPGWSKLAPAGTLSGVSAAISLEGLRLSGTGNAKLGADDGWFAAVPSAGLTPAMLKFLPRETVAFAAAHVEGEAGAARLLVGWERLGKSLGVPPPPKARLQEIEAGAKLSLAKDFAPRLRAAAVAGVSFGPGQPSMPLFVLEAQDAAAAEWLMQTGLPRLAQGLSKAAEPPAWAPGLNLGTHRLDLGGEQQLHAARLDTVVLVAPEAQVLLTAKECGAEALARHPAFATLLQAGEEPGLILGARPARFALPTEAAAAPTAAANGGAAAAAAGAGVPPAAAGAPATAPPPAQAKPLAGPNAGAAALAAPPAPAAAPEAPGGVMGLPRRQLPGPPPLFFGAHGDAFLADDWLALGLRRQGELLAIRSSSFELAPRLRQAVEALARIEWARPDDSSVLLGGAKLDVLVERHGGRPPVPATLEAPIRKEDKGGGKPPGER